MSGIMERYDALSGSIGISAGDVPAEYSTSAAMFRGLADALAAKFADGTPSHGVVADMELDELGGEWVNDRAFRRQFEGTVLVAIDVPVEEDGETLHGVRLEFSVEGYAYESADALWIHEATADSLCGFEYENSQPQA